MPKLTLPKVGPLPRFELPGFPIIGNPRDIHQGKKVGIGITIKNTGPIAAAPLITGDIKNPEGGPWKSFRFDLSSMAPGGSESKEALFDTTGFPLGEYPGEVGLSIPNVPAFSPLKKGFSFNLIGALIPVGAIVITPVPDVRTVGAGETLNGGWSIKNISQVPLNFYFGMRADFVLAGKITHYFLTTGAWLQAGPYTLQPQEEYAPDFIPFHWHIPVDTPAGSTLVAYSKAWDVKDSSKEYAPERSAMVATITSAVRLPQFEPAIEVMERD